jgi:hypothetical protein
LHSIKFPSSKLSIIFLWHSMFTHIRKLL